MAELVIMTADEFRTFMEEVAERVAQNMMEEFREEQQNRNQLMTLKEAAKLLNVSAATIRRRMEEGLLPRLDVGGEIRFRRADVQNLIRESKKAGTR